MATEHEELVLEIKGYQIFRVKGADGNSVPTSRFIVRGPGGESFGEFQSIEEAEKYISDNLNQNDMALPPPSIKEEQKNNIVSSSYPMP
jgi:hypothetical protein